MVIAESDSEPEEAAVRVSRPRNRHHQRRASSSVEKIITVSDESVTSAPQKGILKAKVAATRLKKRSNKEEQKRVRFSLEGKTLASVSSSDDSDTSEEENDVEMEMDLGHTGDTEPTDLITHPGDLEDIGNLEDMEDFSDSNEESDLESEDGYIETDSSEGENEEEGIEGDALEGSSSAAAGCSVGDDSSHVYVPPHLREGKKSETRERLRKNVQGLVNR